MHCSVRPPQEHFFFYSSLRGLIRVFKFNASTRCLKICYFKYLKCTCTVLRNIDKNLVIQFH